MEELNLAIEAIVVQKPIIGYWLNWMTFISVAAVLFVWKQPIARLALAAFILIIPLGLGIFSLTGEVHLIGLAHILIWGPLAVYMYRNCGSLNKKSAYGVWYMLFFITICISLVFDVRDVVLVLLGSR